MGDGIRVGDGWGKWWETEEGKGQENGEGLRAGGRKGGRLGVKGRIKGGRWSGVKGRRMGIGQRAGERG